jgi:hypothetical protein
MNGPRERTPDEPTASLGPRTTCRIAYPLPFAHPFSKSNPNVATASTAHAGRLQSRLAAR